jgi:hypothetical protein
MVGLWIVHIVAQIKNSIVYKNWIKEEGKEALGRKN